MLRRASSLHGYTLHAQDDNIGDVHDFYFSTADWTVRYLIVDIGNWFTGRRVMVAPYALQTPNWESREIPVALTKAEIKESPPVDLTQPVTRTHETSLSSHYGWPAYWGLPGAAGMGGVGLGMGSTAGLDPIAMSGAQIPDDVLPGVAEKVTYADDERSLLSMREVTGYQLEATDGSLGHVEDFFVEDEDWRIGYLLIDTSNWLPGKRVLIAPEWVTEIDWTRSRLYVDLTKAQVEQSPEYNPEAAINRDYEKRLYQHYGYMTQW